MLEYKERRALLKQLCNEKGYKSVSDFAAKTKSFTGKNRSNALIHAHLTKGCYDIRHLEKYADDLKTSMQNIKKIFVL